jgi:hypothetical protein
MLLAWGKQEMNAVFGLRKLRRAACQDVGIRAEVISKMDCEVTRKGPISQ